MLNKDFILRKIKLIQEDLSHLESFGDFALDESTRDKMEYIATERILERMVTRAIDVNKHLIASLGQGDESVKTYQETFLVLSKLGVYNKNFAEQIAPSAGLRNILVHEYDEIEVPQIYNSRLQALRQYAQYCDFILKFLESNQ